MEGNIMNVSMREIMNKRTKTIIILFLIILGIVIVSPEIVQSQYFQDYIRAESYYLD